MQVCWKISPFLLNLRTLIHSIQSLSFVLKTPFGTCLLLQALLMPLNKLLHYLKNLLKTKLLLLLETLDLIHLKNTSKRNSSLIYINSFWNTGLVCFFIVSSWLATYNLHSAQLKCQFHSPSLILEKEFPFLLNLLRNVFQVCKIKNCPKNCYFLDYEL